MFSFLHPFTFSFSAEERWRLLSEDVGRLVGWGCGMGCCCLVLNRERGPGSVLFVAWGKYLGEAYAPCAAPRCWSLGGGVGWDVRSAWWRGWDGMSRFEGERVGG